MGFAWKHGARAMIAALVATGTLLAGAATAATASAAQTGDTAGMPGYNFDGGVGLGPVGKAEDGSWVYCIESGTNVGSFDGTWQDATSGDEKTAAWMIEDTKNDSSDLTQAAVAYAIHEHLDEGSTQWKTVKQANLKGVDKQQVIDKATQLWNTAANKVVANSKWEKVKYTKGMMQGVITAELQDAAGNYVSGVPYTVEYDNTELKIDNPTGVTGNGPIAINWTALKNGEAKVHVKYDVQTLAKLIPRDGQHKIKGTEPRTGSTSDVEFKVVRGMQPRVTSDAEAAIDQSAKVTGVNGKEYAASEYKSDTDVTYTEHGLADMFNVNVDDLDGDKANVDKDGFNQDPDDWLHTQAGYDTAANGGQLDASTQVTLTGRMRFYGPYTREQAKQYQKQRAEAEKAGRTLDPPADAKQQYEATVTTNHAGAIRVSTDDGTITDMNGQKVDSASVPAGYWIATVEMLNKDQAEAAQQTGMQVREESAAGAKDGYPFLEDTKDSFAAAKETVNTRFHVKVKSQIERAGLKTGVVNDKLIVNKLNDGDLWPTYTEANVTEGEDASNDPVALDFTGTWYGPFTKKEWAEVKDATTVPDKYKDRVAHVSTVKGVTKYGEYSTDSWNVNPNDDANYTVQWTFTPQLKGSQKLDNEAWRQLSHGVLSDRFADPDESFGFEKTTPACTITTKTQGKVEAVGGKADIHDTAYLKCEEAAKIQFELWKQNNGDSGNDVKITTTVTQDVNGRTQIDSEKVTVPVQPGDKYYWREIARNSKGDVIAYGSPRVSDETVEITSKPELPKTGMAMLTVGLAAGAAILVAGGTLLVLKRRKHADVSDDETAAQTPLAVD